MANSTEASKNSDTGATANLISAIAQDADKDVGLSAITNFFGNKNAKSAAQDNINTIKNQNQAISDAIKNYYANNSISQNASSADVAKYYSALENYNPNDYVYDFDEFNYDKSVSDFENPNKQQIIADTAKTTQQTAAGAGLGRGTGAATQIATDVANKNEDIYNTALNEYNTDRSQAYNEYSNYITNNQNKLNTLAQATNNQITNLGTVANQFTNNEENEFENTLNAQQAGYAAYNTAKSAKDNTGNADSGVFGVIASLF
jgi:hypothetical protein